MRKLKLDLNALQVESFDVRKPALGTQGTVHGAANTDPPLTLTIPDTGSDDIFPTISCTDCIPSNEATCRGTTCGDTCWPTCHC
ncbi:MAG TPA: hypothetical protein VFX98_13260 [Longimicrobiaceae bacterium]|nr:hypothetical protein [Longimicrobiaceae bacterium]